MRGVERSAIYVCVLGKLRVRVGEVPVDLTSDRLRALVATLAMAADRPVSVERLIDAAWGDDLPDDPRRTLQTYVHRLRRALGDDAITTEPEGYALRTDPDAVDALRFMRLIDHARSDPATERAALIEALLLWRGDPFDGINSSWLAENESTRLRERHLEALERRVDLDLADGRHAEVVAELDALVAEHPFREPLWARLLRALAGSGRQADALDTYATLRRRIGDALGVEPSAELRSIHAALLAGDSERTPVTRGTTPLVPRQLPVDIPGFTGRTTALDLLDSALERVGGDRVGIVAVYGAGGVGKTSLVVHWAHRTKARFPDGQLYVNLRGYDPESPVPPASALDSVLRDLGVDGAGIPATESARSSLLRSLLAERRQLIILDNARDAEQVRPLLPGSGGSMVVVTSRSQLRSLVAREGASRLALDQLAPRDSVALLADSLSRAGVAYEVEQLRTLADRCDHLPLALAIAAERTTRDPDTGLAALLEELAGEFERLDAFDTGEGSADLRTVFAWSYGSLDPDTAHMFRMLGLHPGPDIGVPAAAALAGVDRVEAKRRLDRLVDTNLLLQRRAGRYELHDLLRVYAAELSEQRTDPAQRSAGLERCIEWYVHSTHNGHTVLRSLPEVIDVGGPPPTIRPMTFDSLAQALDWFDAEHDTITACVHLAADNGYDRAVYQLVDLIQVYLRRQRAFDDLLALAPLALDAAQRTADVAAEAQMTNLIGIVHAELRRLDESIEYLDRALKLFEQVDHLEGQQRTLVNLGITRDQAGNLGEAAADLARAVAINRRREPGHETAVSLVRSLYNQAELCVRLCRAEEAAELGTEAVGLCARYPMDALFAGNAHDTLANAFAALGRHSDAIRHSEQAIDLFRSSQDRWFECIALARLGRSYGAIEEYARARSVAEQALALFDAIGAVDGMDLSRADIVALVDDVTRQPIEVTHR